MYLLKDLVPFMFYKEDHTVVSSFIHNCNNKIKCMYAKDFCQTVNFQDYVLLFSSVCVYTAS